MFHVILSSTLNIKYLYLYCIIINHFFKNNSSKRWLLSLRSSKSRATRRRSSRRQEVQSRAMRRKRPKRTTTTKKKKKTSPLKWRCSRSTRLPSTRKSCILCASACAQSATALRKIDTLESRRLKKWSRLRKK